MPVKLNVDKISLSFGGIKALHEVEFQVEAGEIFAVIGAQRRRQDQPHQQHQRLLPAAERGASSSTASTSRIPRPTAGRAWAYRAPFKISRSTPTRPCSII